MPPVRLRYIDAAQAAAIEAALLSPAYGFSLDQLMELAGLACAQTVLECYPPSSFTSVLVAAGPDNQGGDGLVAARHLHHFGYDVQVWYPKPKQAPLFDRLATQLRSLHIPLLTCDDFEDAYMQCDVVLDAIFGFSFHGPVRAPFKDAIELLKNDSLMEFEYRRKRPPIVSIDVPSASDVDQGHTNPSLMPQVLLSLMAPKQGAAQFTGQHFLGGRFVPDVLDHAHNLFLPAFPGASQIVDITGSTPLQDAEIAEYAQQRDRDQSSASGGPGASAAPSTSP